jgi:hypothetical protein
MSGGSQRSTLSFDSVRVAGKTLSLDEFLELSLPTRVRHLLKEEIVFLRGDVPVLVSVALSELRKLAADKGPRPAT